MLLCEAAAEMWELSEACSEERMTETGQLSVDIVEKLMGHTHDKLGRALDRFAEITRRPNSQAARESGKKLAAALSRH